MPSDVLRGSTLGSDIIDSCLTSDFTELDGMDLSRYGLSSSLIIDILGCLNSASYLSRFTGSIMSSGVIVPPIVAVDIRAYAFILNLIYC